jgi:formylglycine-generating enzyme required for sulfatase activity
MVHDQLQIEGHLKSLKRYNLLTLADQLGLKKFSKLKRDQLITLITNQCSIEQIRTAIKILDAKPKKKWWQKPVKIIHITGAMASILGLILTLIVLFPRNQNDSENLREPPNEIGEMPDGVRAVSSKGIKVKKNKKGFWEAFYRDGIVMVYIPSGGFTMGSNDGDSKEKPPHKVFLDGYWIGKNEITIGQYNTFIYEVGHQSLPVRVSKYSPNDNHPVVGISWDDAVAYCEWLSKKIGMNFALPKEAQWEKAARYPENNKYPWGNHEPYYSRKYYANYDAGKKEDGFQYTAPVGSYPQGASQTGLMDMAGNVSEWCYDWYEDSYYYKKENIRNPVGPVSGSRRVIRGGSWNDNVSSIRCSKRLIGMPDNGYKDVGFRLCQNNQ